MVDAVSSHGSGMYFNFTEHRVDRADIYEPESYRRLQAVTRAIDPGNRVLANHSIPPEADVISLDDHRPTPHALANSLALVGPIASTLAERAARSIKAYAERDEFEVEFGARVTRAA
jgi:hypothetical protein